MKKKYILNSAVLTAFGSYTYEKISTENLIKWISTNEWESTIGYPETAQALETICQTPIPVNRKTIIMHEGDEALVFRLVFPQGYRPDPTRKGSQGIDFILQNCEMGILKRMG